jgi:hypothetical protein
MLECIAGLEVSTRKMSEAKPHFDAFCAIFCPVLDDCKTISPCHYMNVVCCVCARECIAGRSITVKLADPLNGVSYNTTITMEGEAADCRATAILVS